MAKHVAKLQQAAISVYSPYEECQTVMRDFVHSANGWPTYSREIVMKKFLLAAALTAACGVAAAQGYAGALIGMSKFDCSGLCSKDTDTAYKIYGGYDMGSNLAIEVAYANFGKVKLDANGATGEGKASVLSVVAAMRFPLTTDLAGVGRLGLGFVDSKASATAPGQSSKAESKGVNLYAGLGLEYSIANDFKLVSQFDLADNGDIYLFGIGAQLAY